MICGFKYKIQYTSYLKFVIYSTFGKSNISPEKRFVLKLNTTVRSTNERKIITKFLLPFHTFEIGWKSGKALLARIL